MSIVNPKDMQSAQNNGPMGRTQFQTAPTHEGSMLTSFENSGVSESNTPNLSK